MPKSRPRNGLCCLSLAVRTARLAACSVSVVLLTIACPANAESDGDRRVSFSRDVRPLLSDRCFQCHGPDRIARQANLRLDQEADVFSERDGTHVVVAGDPAASELIRRMTAHDADEVMPPADSGRTLSAAEIALIKRWVEQGAMWEQHWAFLTPQRPELPPLRDSSWARNAIDDFVLARLERAALRPAPEADRRTLLRRISLDLTGLPPTLQEIDDFLRDDSPQAYEAAVERLLQSPHYGERMALPWLEAARYADSSGYQEDYGRYMYPWRDWVIEAFNRNLPFDQFVIEQMAGDLLPNATPEQVLATGFHRNHRINQEVGAIPEEFLVEYAIDRLETVGTIFLGVTIGCCRCHEHKYDPFTQKEFYELYAFFNNNDDDGVDQTSRFGFCKPFIEWPTEEGRQQLAVMEGRLGELTSQQSPSDVEQTAYEQWLTQAQDDPPVGLSDWQAIGPFEHADASKQSGFEHAFLAEPQFDLQTPVGESTWKPHPEWNDGTTLFLNGEFATYYVSREVDLPMETELQFHFGASDAYKLWVDGVLFSERLEGTTSVPKTETMRICLASGPHVLLVKLSNAEFSQGFTFKLADRTAVPPTVFAILGKPADQRTTDEQGALYAYFHGLRVAALEKEIAQLKGTFPKVMVMCERAEVRPAHVLQRGSYSQPGELVGRNTPAVLPPFPQDQPRDRLGLARWLVSPEHPLTARVTVNRFWQMFFGVGLVKTTEDFGAQGEWPSHPDLLDWLARQFIDSGWDVKALVRLIVTSAAYRQSSQMTPETYARDPENRLLARGPRFRLRPQFLRDQALSVSGLMVGDVGGPPVKPYQPDGLWSDVSNLLLQKQWYLTNDYVQDHGPSLYRRSLYTFWKRAVPPPGMTVFDAESREVCTVRSSRSNTPLQAMNLLNDPTYVEAARHLAHRLLTEAGDTPSDRLAYGMELATGRLPDDEEMEILLRALDRHVSIYRNDPDAAKELLSHGESENPGGHDPVEHAAFTQIGLLLLNLDETITKQ
ncbi:MAG: PSD1 and planctomycete cytochrome C domain-containing protein [Planctomycetaceae bacterium]